MDDLDGENVPGLLVEAYLEREAGIRSLLDDLASRALAGEHQAVRERLRAFAEEDRPAFLAVGLAMTGSTHFFGDVEADLDVDAADSLRALPDRYPALVEPVGIVRLEVTEGRHNPLTGLEASTHYGAEADVPTVAYTAYSGDLALYESRGPPEELLATATYLLEATNDALAAAMDRDRSVSTDELSALIDRRETLETELSTLRDRIDGLRRVPNDD